MGLTSVIPSWSSGLTFPHPRFFSVISSRSGSPRRRMTRGALRYESPAADADASMITAHMLECAPWTSRSAIYSSLQASLTPVR